jgi:AAA15 family ATPase/GTPase
MNGGSAMLYASVNYLAEKIPVGMLSGGISKLLSLLLAIAAKRQSVVLIDEIENGFYHTRMPHIWRTLLDLCKSYEVQIFASTHGLECLQAIAEAAKGKEDQFCLLRTVKENGKCVVKQFAGQQFIGAIQDDIEVR